MLTGDSIRYWLINVCIGKLEGIRAKEGRRYIITVSLYEQVGHRKDERLKIHVNSFTRNLDSTWMKLRVQRLHG